ISLEYDHLSPRITHTTVHPSAAIEPHGHYTLPGQAVQTAPMFEPDLNDAVLLRAVLPVATWQSAVCVPLTDRGEMLAILTIVSPKKAAFGLKVIEELAPLKSMATFALAERLHLATYLAEQPDPEAARRAASDFLERAELL